MPFVGPVDIANMKTSPYDDDIILSWDCLNPNAEVTIYAATGNLFQTGGKDKWIKLDTVSAADRSYRIKGLPASSFYKFVLQTPHNHLNRWVSR